MAGARAVAQRDHLRAGRGVPRPLRGACEGRPVRHQREHHKPGLPDARGAPARDAGAPDARGARGDSGDLGGAPPVPVLRRDRRDDRRHRAERAPRARLRRSLVAPHVPSAHRGVLGAARGLRVGWRVPGYDLGEALANLVQPFWMLPTLAILGLRTSDVMGFPFVVFLVLVPVVLVMVTVLGATLPYPL